jgi:hypothetical protein
MLGVSPAQLVGPVEELLGANLLVEREESLTFSHELTREAVRGSLPQPVRRAFDRQAADVLLAAGALPVEVAIQLAESAPPGDDVAISTLLQAAEALATTDPGASADLGQRGPGPCSENPSPSRTPRRADGDGASRRRADRRGEGVCR